MADDARVVVVTGANRGLGREIDEQRRVPDRGTSKSEE